MASDPGRSRVTGALRLAAAIELAGQKAGDRDHREGERGERIDEAEMRLDEAARIAGDDGPPTA